MVNRKTFAAAAVATALYLVVSGAALAEQTITVDVINQSEMDRWVRITDMNCGTVLHEDRLGAMTTMPVSLCADDNGMAKLQFYIRTGCTKNKTVLRKDIVAGSLIAF